MLLLAALWIVVASAGSAANTIYSNEDYGFMVIVPFGLSVERDEPPRPDHGFGVTLGAGRNIFVVANYDVLEAGSATVALHQSLAYRRPDADIPVHQARLVGLPAARAAVIHGPTRGVRLVAFRAHDRQIAVIYEFYLDTDAAHARQDSTTFRRILHGVCTEATSVVGAKPTGHLIVDRSKVCSIPIEFMLRRREYEHRGAA